MHFQRCTVARLVPVLCALCVSLLAVPAGAAPPLRAPWTCGQTHAVSQSHNVGSHLGKGKNAWDFALPVGTPIVAPAAGVVRKVRQDSTRYGCSSSYAYDANYVIVAFDDGTEALFLHLQAHSSPLKVGDRVEVGDLVGKVGMSGWTCGPHLHFQVQKTCDSWWCPSVPASFAKYGDPYTGEELTSANCPRDENAPQMASNQSDSNQSDKQTDDKAKEATQSQPEQATGGGDAAPAEATQTPKE